MANHFLLFDRPRVMNEAEAMLQVVGELPDYEAGDPFEGRLDVLNSIGRCSVEVLESSLPPGHSVRMDNVLKQVVIRWPGYSPEGEDAKVVPNGDFEAGDDGSWKMQNPWRIVAGKGEGGGSAAEFGINFKGISSIEGLFVPYRGQSITASAKFQQGASSKGNLNGRVLLLWGDERGRMLPGGEDKSYAGGNLIKSGARDYWHTSTVTAASATAKTVAVGFSCKRSSQNHPAYVDNITWNHTYKVGVDNTSDDFFLSIKVTDSANRAAYWSGTVFSVSRWFTSVLYPIVITDSLEVAREVDEPSLVVSVKEAPVTGSSASVGRGLSGILLESTSPPKFTHNLTLVRGVQYVALIDPPYSRIKDEGTVVRAMPGISLGAVPYGKAPDNATVTRTISEVTLT